MKTFNKIIMSLGVAATALGFSSCVNDLDLDPRNPNEFTDVTGDMDRVFADLYLQFATFGANNDSPVKDFDSGMSSFQRALSIAEEYPTDEVAWVWDPGAYGTINYGLTSPELDCVFGFYSRLIINIALCNQFISNVDGGHFSLDDAGRARAEQYKLQARTLRGLCYYYMLSFYDKIPYATEATAIGSQPEQLSRQQVLANVTSDLEEVVAAYGASQTPAYGFVGLDAAEAVLVKIYLNAEQWTGTPAYDKCYQHAKNIINRIGKGGYYGNGLARSFVALFGANNAQYAIGNPGNTVNEIIWTLPQNNPKLLSWQGSTYLIDGWLGSNGAQRTMAKPTMNKYTLPGSDELDEEKYLDLNEEYCASQDEYNEKMKAYNDEQKAWKKQVTMRIHNHNYSFDPEAKGIMMQEWFNAGDSWNGFRARKSFIQKFEWDDVECTKSADLRTSNFLTATYNFTLENTILSGDAPEAGYRALKYTNWCYNEDGTVDYVASAKMTIQPQTEGDYAVIRLAEIYLSAAEAILNGGGGSQAEADEYVNYIRRRAYGLAPGDTSRDFKGISMAQLRDERCRELYQENVRRTDLIRWNLFTSGYNWEWKGGVAGGTNLPERAKLYPIPSRMINSSTLQQTTGY